MKRKVKFYPEFCEAIADGINMIGMFGGVSEKKVQVDVTFPTIDPGSIIGERNPDPVVAFHVTVTPELIMELLPYHQKAQNQLLTDTDEFMFVAHADGMPELLLILEKDEIAVLCMVADKIIAGARGELVPDLSGEIEVVENGSASPVRTDADTGGV